MAKGLSNGDQRALLEIGGQCSCHLLQDDVKVVFCLFESIVFDNVGMLQV